MGNKEIKSNSYNQKKEPKIWFIVDNVVEMYAKLEEKNVQFLCKPYRVEKGNAIEFISSSGNRLYISDYSLLKES